MNKIETNALRIAELKGYKKVSQRIGMQNIYTVPDCESLHEGLIAESKIVELFSSYNGLMPIVYECNKSKDFYYSRIYINPQGYDTISIFNYCDSQELSDLVANFDYNRESEPEFIEAIQLACIKYLELKNETK